MKQLFILGLTILAAGALSANAADAKALWTKDCSKCHGPDGAGKTAMGKKLGVKDYTDAKVQAAMKDEEITKAIKEGVKKGDKTLMKAFSEYTDEDVKAMLTFIRAMKKS